MKIYTDDGTVAGVTETSATCPYIVAIGRYFHYKAFHHFYLSCTKLIVSVWKSTIVQLARKVSEGSNFVTVSLKFVTASTVYGESS